MPEKLFEPLQLGGNGITLGHRIALAPLTRFRAEKSHTASGEHALREPVSSSSR